MVLFLKGHGFAYELENVLRSFAVDVTVKTGRPEPAFKGDYAYLRVTKAGETQKLLCTVQKDLIRLVKGSSLAAAADTYLEQTLAALLYDVMAAATGFWPPWGIMTGVRPAKYVAGMLQRGYTDAQAEWELCAAHRVSAEKARLAIQTAHNGLRLARHNEKKAYSLYVSIPFCPSRCSYCSFISKTVERDHALMDGYVQTLCEELRVTAGIAESLGLRLATIYIGGGTPTSLAEQQLQALTDCIARHFPVGQAEEYTVEAGRPDTITRSKLQLLKQAGVTRISINPQTANDAVRAAIGRGHTAKQTEQAFALAREAGFSNINMDVIAGLPQDNIGSFGHTMEWLFQMNPESITVHALTLKRASNLSAMGGNPSHDAARMVRHAAQVLSQRGYTPYYMYKQKGTVDGLENTGYAKQGAACVYNVYMMDELHTVLACGAGAVTKLVNQQSGRIERVFNYKYPAEYMAGFAALLSRKEKITTFYEDII